MDDAEEEDTLPAEDPWFHAVRRRPEMFVGTTDGVVTLAQLAAQVVPLAERSFNLRLHQDGTLAATVDAEVSPEPGSAFSGQSALESLLVDGRWSVINALSEACTVETSWRGNLWRLHCARGLLVDAPVVVGEATEPTLRVRFKPDPQIFAATVPEVAQLHTMLMDLAARTPGARLHFQDDWTRENHTFHFPRGVVDLLVARFGRDAFFPADEPLHVQVGAAQFALMWTRDADEQFYVMGPEHPVIGVRRGVALVARALAALQGAAPDGVDGCRGIRCVVMAGDDVNAPEVGRHVSTALLQTLQRHPGAARTWLAQQVG